MVTRGGVERTIADPSGAEFPWKPPHPKAALEDGPLLSCGARDSNEPMLHEELRHCFKGVYFSAHWVYIHLCIFIIIYDRIVTKDIGKLIYTPMYIFFLIINCLLLQFSFAMID